METENIIYLASAIHIGLIIFFFSILLKMKKNQNKLIIELQLNNENLKLLVAEKNLTPKSIEYVEIENDGWGNKISVPEIQ